MNTPQFELISFPLCPFVHRSLITLQHKKVPFSLKEIDLENPPEWFLKISPMGKVPVLRVNDDTVLFESAVINEYLDEVNPPALIAKDPLIKAKERAWIEYCSELIMAFYTLCNEEDLESFEDQMDEFFEDVEKLEPVLGNGPYFRGSDFSLIDTSYAPLFVRLSSIPMIWGHAFWKEMPKTRKWAETLVKNPDVIAATPKGFAERYPASVKEMSPFLFA
jgi:glutathione S-transferase